MHPEDLINHPQKIQQAALVIRDAQLRLLYNLSMRLARVLPNIPEFIILAVIVKDLEHKQQYPSWLLDQGSRSATTLSVLEFMEKWKESAHARKMIRSDLGNVKLSGKNERNLAGFCVLLDDLEEDLDAIL